MTDYIVLQRLIQNTAATGESNVQTWREFKRVAAQSADAAVRHSAAETAGEFVAVPARSWSPVKVLVETTKTVKLERKPGQP